MDIAIAMQSFWQGRNGCADDLISKVYCPLESIFHRLHDYNGAEMTVYFEVISKHALLQGRVPSNFDLDSRGDHNLLKVPSSKHLLALTAQIQHHCVEHDRIFRLVVKSLRGDLWFDWFDHISGTWAKNRKKFSDSRLRTKTKPTIGIWLQFKK